VKNAGEIVKAINMAMAIESGKQAWSEVSRDTLVKSFKKPKLYPQEIGGDDDLFEVEDELPALQELLDKVGSSCDAETFISAEESIDVCLRYMDKSNPNWRNELREQSLGDEEAVMLSAPSEKQERTNEVEDDDEFGPSPRYQRPTVSKAEEVAEQLRDFAQFHGNEELSLAL